MKNRKWLKLVWATMLPAMAMFAQAPVAESPAGPPPGQPASATPADLPQGAAEVVRLSEAGTSEDVMLSYIRNSNYRFNLTADQILYLRDIGFSSPVISAMLDRDHELQSQPQTYTYDQKVYPPANPAAVAPQPASVTVPEQPAAPAPAETPTPTYVSSPPAEVTYFYNDLAPYGTWVQLDGYGWCWQPRVVAVNHVWRPYCDGGYWVYSDAGWYWQSSYSWGWAPFHYGRWYMHPGCGWVWLPDRVWGPSWVVWRSYGDNCGWAPLPPHAVFEAGFGWRFNGVSVAVNFDFGLRPDHFTFVAYKDFNNHDLGHRCLAPTEVTQIYNHTTVINNYVVNNNTIVNQGIKVDRVAAATHSQIRTVAIRDVPAHSPQVTRTQTVGSSSSVLYRPQLAAPTHPTTMVAQKVDDRHPVIQHAPVATAKPAKVPAARNNSLSAANTVRTTQLENGRNAHQPAPENPSYRQENPAHRPSAAMAENPSYRQDNPAHRPSGATAASPGPTSTHPSTESLGRPD